MTLETSCPSERSRAMADRVERFVRDVLVPYSPKRSVTWRAIAQS